jgi:arylsulfatase A-like enzyme
VPLPGFAWRALAFGAGSQALFTALRRAAAPQPGLAEMLAWLALAACGSTVLAAGLAGPARGAAPEPATGVARVRLALAPLAAAALLAIFSALAAAPRVGSGLPAVGAPAPRAASPAARRPNLLLVSIDTLRADHLGAYGYARDTSPVLDRLAAGGVRFETAISSAPWTLPAHASLFSSRLASELPDYEIAGSEHLARILRRAGYHTAAFTAGRFVDRRRFGEGFDVFVDELEDAYLLGAPPVMLCAALRARGALRHAGVGVPWLAALNHWRESERAGVVSAWAGPLPSARAAAAWLAGRDAREPFFLFFHTFGVHEYYLHTAEIRDAAERFAGDYDGWLRRSALRYGAALPAPGPHLDYLVALYDGAIRASDEALGIVLGALSARGLDDDTLVIVVSDHGEGFRPELGRSWHRVRLHDDLVRVPLLLRLPGGAHAARTVSQPVSLVDVLPTALDVLGLEPPAGARGRSLLPLLERPNAAGPTPVAISESAEYQERLRDVSARSAGAKLIRHAAGGEDLYDLARDPGETRALSDHPERHALLEALGGLGRAPAPEPDADTRAMLRALGYAR